MRRVHLFAALAAWVICALVHAQSVQPSVVEYTNATDGQFDVVNDSLLPLVVTIEAKSFTIDPEGVAAFRRLDPAIHLRLSETSLRVPPHGRRTVFYKASADSYPAWFCVYSSFSGLPRRGAVNVALDLPHTVYLLSKTEAKRDQVVLEDLHDESSELRGTVRNRSSNVVRLQSLQWVDVSGKKGESGGFPLLPGGTRELHLALPPNGRAKLLRAKLNRLTVEGAVR